MKENIKKWLVEWFSNSSTKSIVEVQSQTSENYFSLGLIDSFGFIGLLSDIEEKFGVTFSNDDFLNRSFSTIDGLSQIIEKKLQ